MGVSNFLISEAEWAKLHLLPRAQCPICENRHNFVLWKVLVARSSSLVWAYLQLWSLQTPVWMSVLHSFVHVKSGSGRISTLSCANGHCSPFAHIPMIWNLHILVLENCHVRV